MPFLRDRTPSQRDYPSLMAWLERTFQSLEDWTIGIEADVARLIRLAAINGVTVDYTFNSDTDGAVPVPSGQIKLNDNQSEQATEVIASKFDIFGRNIFPEGAGNLNNGWLTLVDTTRSYIVEYEITGDSIERATDVVVPVAFVDGSGGNEPLDGDLVVTTWLPEVV